MQLYKVNPLNDLRWSEFAQKHAQATAFHQSGWLEALRRTYGYEPMALTTAAPGQVLSNGMPLCKVSSWMTGTRLVSLPFADHCQPLVGTSQELREFTDALQAECNRRSWKYVELRPLSQNFKAYGEIERCASFWFHSLDLGLSLENIFSGLHKNSFQRKIRRAERESLSYEVGRSQRLVDEFYGLLISTRRRHHLLPQPRAWFKNLVDCMGDAVRIRVARKDEKPIAAMLSLRNQSSVIYKYGCSDAEYHPLGGMPMLFWKLIQESKAAGADNIDLGRCDLEHNGLMVFKDRLGASKRYLSYYRYTNQKVRSRSAVPGVLTNLSNMFHLPDVVLSAAGKMLYRHLG